jgi:cell division transport system ATP-binding protein
MEKELLITYRDVDICQEELTVLRNVDVEVARGELVYLLGKVGSGKSTFLKSLYAEVPVRQGFARVFDYDLLKIKRKQIPFLRRKIGIIFQDFQLLPDRTVHENLAFVLQATGWKNKQEIDEQVTQVLHQTGIGHKALKMPHQLSGGEQQRVVIARALLNSPELIIADEPTGNLDPETGHKLIELLYEIHQAGTAVIIATHNLRWVEEFPGRIFHCATERMKEENTKVAQSEEDTEESEEIQEIAASPDELPKVLADLNAKMNQEEAPGNDKEPDANT